MDRIHQLQPGIVVSPRFFGYGDYKTLEGDKALPNTKQTGWSGCAQPLRIRVEGYTKAPLKLRPMYSIGGSLCRSSNANLFVERVLQTVYLIDGMIGGLHEIATTG